MDEDIDMTCQLLNVDTRPTYSGEITHFSNHSFGFSSRTLGPDFFNHVGQFLRISSHQNQPGTRGRKQPRHFCSKARSRTSNDDRFASQIKI